MAISRLRLQLTRSLTIAIFTTLLVGGAYWDNAHPLVEKTLFALGITLASLGAVGRAWCTAYISGHKLKTLVTSGPYSLCRNPIYFFSLIFAAGISFCTETLTIPLTVVIGLTALYRFQIRREERILKLQFGSEYTKYQQTTPRFFPSNRRFHEPERLCVSARLFKRGLFGIGFLLMLIGAIQLLEAFHETRLLPTLFRIY